MDEVVSKMEQNSTIRPSEMETVLTETHPFDKAISDWRFVVLPGSTTA